MLCRWIYATCFLDDRGNMTTHAMHNDRSNSYTFWNFGKRRDLKTMDSTAIKIDEVFVPRPDPVRTTPKPRMVWIQEGGDDEDIPKSITSPVDVSIATSTKKEGGIGARHLRYIIPARRRAGCLPGAVRPPLEGGQTGLPGPKLRNEPGLTLKFMGYMGLARNLVSQHHRHSKIRIWLSVGCLHML